MNATSGRVWTISLPWQRPPLHLNDRTHWAAKAKLTAMVRKTAWTLARANRVPTLDRCEVTLIWAPPDRRTRDADNLVATLKPLCDGLVDANIVPDDTPWFMVKHMPRITSPMRPSAMWLVVRELSKETA